MNARLAAVALAGVVVGAACGDPGNAPGTATGPDETARMVQRLEELRDGLDRRRSPFNNRARAVQIASQGPGAGLQGEMEYRGQLSEQILYGGWFDEAADSLESMLRSMDQNAGRVPPEFRRLITELLGTAYLKWEEQLACVARAEVERCLVSTRTEPRPADSPGREAVRVFTGLLGENPEDLQSRWLLNVSYMLLGEYPDGVPERWLIPPAALGTEDDLGRFEDIAGLLGVDDVGHAGGAILDDFDRDGHLDILTSGWLLEDSVRYYRSDGAGGFVDRTREAGISGLVGGLNMKQADYDNDGYLDVFVLRGAWLGYGQPNSLLHNRGDGTFEDRTESAGLLEPFSTQTADWADFDLDGRVDLFVGNEAASSRRDRSQLFRNNGDGTFTDVARELGIRLTAYVKGVAWGDYDNDGDPDLYVSVMRGQNRLYRNDVPQGGGFVEVTSTAMVGGPENSFAVWWWDYDNDGWEDLYVSGYRALMSDLAAEALGREFNAELPRLYRNRGDGTFEDVADRVRLDRIQFVMGSNFGDLDTDGFLDFYVATGDPGSESAMPNRMFRNVAGEVFREVTATGGFGHLLKGHAVSFGDADHDGDQDILVNMGGATQADRARNVFYENPGHGARWITLLLEGTRTNRAAIGARVRVTVREGGETRTVHRTVGGGSSFGANSLQLEIGLGAAERIEAVEVDWPVSGVTARYTAVEMDATYQVVEGTDALGRVPVEPFTLGGAARAR